MGNDLVLFEDRIRELFEMYLEDDKYIELYTRLIHEYSSVINIDQMWGIISRIDLEYQLDD